MLAGLVAVGASSGTALLARAAAGDMYPPERRAHGIALVLFGAVFGAILGPLVFSPLLAGRKLDGDALAGLWLAAGVFMLAGLVLVLAVRPDPKRIAELLRTDEEGEPAAAAPLSEIVRRPGAIPALLAGQASFAVMVGVMTLTGAIVVDHQHHAGHFVFPIIGAHVLGMYALVLVVGRVVDRIGRTRALAGGLLIMGVSVSSLLWVQGVAITAVVLFGLGIGWNLSFVSATAQLADCATAAERGKLLGFNDLLAGLTGRRARAARRAGAVGDRRGGAGDRRHRARRHARAVDPGPPAGDGRASGAAALSGARCAGPAGRCPTACARRRRRRSGRSARPAAGRGPTSARGRPWSA